MKKLVVLLLALIAYAPFAKAQEPAVVTSDKPGWHKIGETKADFATESESITVLGKDEFKSIKLKVTDAPVDVDKVVVFYEDEKTQEIPVKGVIKAGAETKAYNLNRPTGDIKKVNFFYRSKPTTQGDKAHVELYGLK